MLARSKLNSVETLTSKALLDYEISHEEYSTIINEKKKCRKMKEEIRMMKIEKNYVEKDETNKEKGRKIETNEKYQRHTENS